MPECICLVRIQFLSDQHPYEKWENYPKAKARMKELILKYNLKNPLFLTGDRHIAELSKTALSPAKQYMILLPVG